jgi:hypothetical protein
MPLTRQEREFHESIPHRECLAVWQGELIEITYTKNPLRPHRPAKRGMIGGFTRAARLRMIRTLCRINWDVVGKMLFVTLTYPDSHVDRSAYERSMDRSWFMRSVEKYLEKKVGALWRLEWKPRKSGSRTGDIACHVHLVLFGVAYLPHAVVNSLWSNALGVSTYLRTDVRRVRGAKAAARYVSKYAAKAADDHSLVNSSYLNATGRHWGILRKELIPWHARHVIPCLDKSDVRLAEGYAASVFAYFMREHGQSFSLFGGKADALGQILFARMIDKENEIR